MLRCSRPLDGAGLCIRPLAAGAECTAGASITICTEDATASIGAMPNFTGAGDTGTTGAGALHTLARAGALYSITGAGAANTATASSPAKVARSTHSSARQLSKSKKVRADFPTCTTEAGEKPPTEAPRECKILPATSPLTLQTISLSSTPDRSMSEIENWKKR